MNSEQIERSLSFASIRSGLKGCCRMVYSRERVDAMVFHRSFVEVNELLQPLRQMMDLLGDVTYSIPKGDVQDVREALFRIRVVGMYMDESELMLLRHSLAYSAELERFFAHLDAERFPLLCGWKPQAIDGAPLQQVITGIDSLIDRYGQLRDSASPELNRIRQAKRQSEGSVARVLNAILSKAKADGIIERDVEPTIREGRLVIPVAPTHKRHFGGIVHDESATGKTVFIEPAAVVEANNRLRELESEERRERIRILSLFAEQIRPHIPSIQTITDWLGEVDFLRAKADYAYQMESIVPEVIDQPVIQWSQARHPLLWLQLKSQGRIVVPLDIGLDEQRRILVISGPNAGGKSVCLKTVALLQYMLQCGLAVPMNEVSKMGVFGQILIDIGDQQSIEDDLSTYSSHLRQMKSFLHAADGRTLLLIDEFGTGTEPLLGGAIAEAVLTALNAQGAWGVITTHYTNLKHLAEQTPGIINGAMLYDRGQLRPLFRLSIGQAGSSFAVEIAQQIGLPRAIIDHATTLIGAEHIDYDRQLQDIARDKRYWENKRQAIRQREKHLEERIAYYEQEIALLKTKRREVMDDAQRQAADLLRESNATIERTIRDIREAQADKQKTRKARQRIEDLKQRVSETVQPGVRKANQPDKPTSPTTTDKQARVLHDLSDLRVLSKNPAKLITETNTPRPRIVMTGIADEVRRKKLAFSRDLDIRGLRADEAQSILIDYLDTAVMVSADQVTILHGTGTGALKQLVRDYLRLMQSRPTSVGMVYHDGDPDRGGAGITVVEWHT